MNFRMIGQVVGRVLCIEAALMLPADDRNCDL